MMYSQNYRQTDLLCILQRRNEISNDKYIPGLLSRDDRGFVFQETVRKGRRASQPKLFDGTYISMVRRPNGAYQCYLKKFQPDRENCRTLARLVYHELLTAFQSID